MLERFVVTFALKEMLQLWIDWLRKCFLQFVNLFRNRAQSVDMPRLVVTAVSVINDREAFP
jgi:hypothetical protein